MITSDEQIAKAIKDNLVWCCGRGVKDSKSLGSRTQFNLLIAEKENGGYLTYILDFNGISARAFKIKGKKPAIFNKYPVFNTIRYIVNKNVEHVKTEDGRNGYAPKKDAEFTFERFPEKELDFFKNSDLLKKIVKRYIDHSGCADKDFVYERAMKNLEEMSTFMNDCIYFKNNDAVISKEEIEDWKKNELPNYLGAKRADEWLSALKGAYQEIVNKRTNAALSRTKNAKFS